MRRAGLRRSPTRNDTLLVRCATPAPRPPASRRRSPSRAKTPVATVDARTLRLGPGMLVVASQPCPHIEQTGTRTRLRFDETLLPPGGERVLAFTVSRGARPVAFPQTVAQAEDARRAAERYWRRLDLPYGRIEVRTPRCRRNSTAPSATSTRRAKSKTACPPFRLAPPATAGCGSWTVRFLLEAVTYLGRTNETRAGMKNLMSFQRPDAGSAH